MAGGGFGPSGLNVNEDDETPSPDYLEAARIQLIGLMCGEQDR